MQEQRTICIDFGNTRQKAALFLGDRQVEVSYLSEHLENDLSDLVEKWLPERSILSSVINHPASIEHLLVSVSKFHLLEAGKSRLPFSTPVGKPETIGADRLALCAAAVLLHPNKNNLVIGLGTAITYNFLNVRNEFLGGGISPGMNMRMKALNSYTAKLPIVEPDWNVPLVGYDTKTNIQSGVVLGIANEIEGFIQRYSEKYETLNVFLTGGDLIHLIPHLQIPMIKDPDLLFKGLFTICDLNV